MITQTSIGLAILGLTVHSAPSLGDWTVTKTEDSVVEAKALTIQGHFGQAINGKSFQQDAVSSHLGYQYVAFYDGERRVCLARRKLPTGTWSLLRFGDYIFKSNDAHNTISLGICPQDGTLHLAFDHHGHPLHYRVSQRGVAIEPETVDWKTALFGPILSELEKAKPIRITYPRFFQTPEGGLQFCYRRGGSGNGDRMLADYDPKKGVWTGTRQIDSGQGIFQGKDGKSASRCSYPNGYNYGPRGRLHATWVWRESSQGANHDLMYAYSEDLGKTWRNNQGYVLSEPPRLTSQGITVVPIGREYGLMNTHGQTVDSKGRVHVVLWHCTDDTLRAAGSRPGEQRWGPLEARRYHHYWRDQEGAWQHRELPGSVGTRAKIFVDEEDNAYVACTDSWLRDPTRRGRFHILAATAATRWEDWQTVLVEEGPFVNEILMDAARWRQEHVLSVLVQESPEEPHQPTPLRVLSFVIEK